MGSRKRRTQGRDSAVLKAATTEGVVALLSSSFERYTCPVAFERSSGTLPQKDGRVRVGDGHGSEDPQGSGKDRHQAFDPSPTLRLTKKPAGNWPQGGTHERGSCEDGHGQTSLRGREHICDHAAGIGERGGAKSAGEEAQDDERLHILRCGRTGVESGESTVRDEEQKLATVHFRQRRPQQRADGEAQHEKRDAPRHHLLACSEPSDDLLDAAGVRGRDKGHGEGDEGDKQGNAPFLEHGEAHGIAGIVGDEVDDIRLLVCAGAIISVVENDRGDEGVGGYHAPIRGVVVSMRGSGLGECVGGRLAIHFGTVA